MEAGETETAALHRECCEELGAGIEILKRIGNARQYFFAEGAWWEMDAAFFLSQLTDAPPANDVTWLLPEEAGRQLYHECHAWAVRLIVGE